MNDLMYDTTVIEYGKDNSNELRLRGLSTRDLTVLATQNMDQLEALFNLVESGFDDQVDVKVFGLELMEKFPGLVAQMIALAADLPNRVGECEKLPAPVQLKAMLSVYELTIDYAGGLQDFLGLVVAIMDKIKKTS